MNLQRIADKLGITVDRLQSLQDTKISESSWPEPQLLRFDKEISGVEAGTVIFKNGEIVWGYPSIRRPLMLEAGIKRHFIDSVAVEEKMNGHNVRITSIDGDIVALTRGGFVCPYSTEVATRLLPEDIFEEKPNLVLCAEMVGPENPYVSLDVYPTDSIDLYLFDVAQKNQRGTHGVHKTHEIAEDFGLKGTAFFGEFPRETAHKRIKEIVIKLGRQGREGVVLKDPENRVAPLKYTSSESNCNDLAIAFSHYNDYALDFILSRAVREGFQSVEWQESVEERKERARRIGESILLPLTETIKNKQQGEIIMQRIKIRVKSLATARGFEYHLRRCGIRAIFDQPLPDDDGYTIGITKIIMSTNDKTEALLNGEMW
ncbi:MAG: RNA ligase [Methanothrix sp.]|jgi:putative ATP-dependent DNA ligase|uniref:RNA ligase n=1 Tax=Methanothrix sp. TaxID=90426 RepID=UPI0025CC5455|nr:RNA ligase [Methanothrix sp.]MCK9405627.1 RNA ligase [Methanothrix sp.]